MEGILKKIRSRIKAAVGVRSEKRAWGEVRAEKRSSVDRIRQESARLRPGIWFPGPGGYGFHWREGRVPKVLGATKLRKSQGGGMRGWVMRLRYHSVLPWALRVPSGNGTHSILIPTKGGTLLMDPKGGHVLRIVPDAQQLLEAAEIRAQMLPHVASPEFEVLDEGRAVREALIAGRSFRDLPVDSRVQVWRRITRSYSSLAAARARGNSSEMVSTAVNAAEESGIPAGLDQVIHSDRAELLEWANRQPTVPAHGDLSDDNLIVELDGSPYLIDFEARCVGYLPFFHDPLLLVLRETRRGRPDLMERIMGGDEEGALAGLWGAAGMSRTPDDLKFALLSVLLIHVYRRNHIPGPPDPKRMRNHLEATWRRSLAGFLSIS